MVFGASVVAGQSVFGRGLISVVSCFGSFACTVQCSSVLNTVVPLDDWFSAQQLCDSFCT
jgi:hypothetical protein